MSGFRPSVIPGEMYGERVIAWREFHDADANEWRYQVFTSGGAEGTVYTVTADGRVVSAGHMYIVGEGVK
jgi:hypothetical protein